MSRRQTKLRELESAINDLDRVQEQFEAIKEIVAEKNRELEKLTTELARFHEDYGRTETEITKTEKAVNTAVEKVQKLWLGLYDELEEGLCAVDDANALADALDLSTH